MNITSYKRRKLRQKPNILAIKQSQEIGELVGLRHLKDIISQGIIPISLFRLRKRKLEAIYSYLLKHQLIHDKEPDIHSLLTHELAEYLLHTIYPGYPACKAKNIAYADYRESRKKDTKQADPLAYDSVPTTEVYDRLYEVYRMDVDWQDREKTDCSIRIPVSVFRKSIERTQFIHQKQKSAIEYHLCFWNSTRTLIKPLCRSLRFDNQEVWDEKHQNLVLEGFMHVDITDRFYCYSPSVSILADATNRQLGKLQSKRSPVTLEVELVGHEEQNISHISISAVARKSIEELVCELYLHTMTEHIARNIQKSTSPLKAQQDAIRLLRYYHTTDDIRDRMRNLENVFMAYLCDTEGLEDVCLTECVSLIDVISQTRIRHPAKSIHCRHPTCFDAAVFFEHHLETRRWSCPICLVHIKDFEVSEFFTPPHFRS
ncbi:hypothetical protein EDC96DRAFT_502803 [Choanephora cucurbitarum]|nr:hypothetical protein EDC96DRAFT_502803 [Choanephora cucurbitarum]